MKPRCNECGRNVEDCYCQWFCEVKVITWRDRLRSRMKQKRTRAKLGK